MYSAPSSLSPKAAIISSKSQVVGDTPDSAIGEGDAGWDELGLGSESDELGFNPQEESVRTSPAASQGVILVVRMR